MTRYDSAEGLAILGGHMSDLSELGFVEEIQKKAKEYAYHSMRRSVIVSSISLVGMILILQFGLTVTLKEFVSVYVSSEWAIIALFLSIVYLIIWVVMLPLSYYEGYVVEHRYDLSTQTKRSWTTDQLKGFILGLVMIIGIIEVIYFLLREFPQVWWIIAWAFMTGFSILMTYIAPVLLMPIFFKYEPIEDDELKNNLTALAEKAGVNVIGVFEMKAEEKTRRAVGALAGIGRTRRILLSDTLLKNYTASEIEGVIGHELGHHVHRDIGKGIIEGAIFMFFGLFLADLFLKNTLGLFGFEDIVDIAALPLFGLILGIFFMVLSPIENTLSRRAERQADLYELEIVNKPDDFISSMTKLCDQNLRDADPHPLVEFLTYDHPSGKRRVEDAIKYRSSLD